MFPARAFCARARLALAAAGETVVMDVEELMFAPVGIAAGLAAGVVAKFAFDQLWGLIDDEEPPEPEHREVSLAKLAVAGALQGAIFRVTRALAEHGARRGFQRWTGTWPGDRRPETT